MATKVPKLEVYQFNAHGDRLYFGERWERLRDIGILENRTVLQQLLLFIDIVVIRVISYGTLSSYHVDSSISPFLLCRS